MSKNPNFPTSENSRNNSANFARPNLETSNSRENSPENSEFSWQKERTSQELQSFISRKLAELADVKIEI